MGRGVALGLAQADFRVQTIRDRLEAVDVADVIEEEVKRQVARELHDGVAQSLTSVLLQMENFKQEQFGRAGVQREVTLLQSSVRHALNNIRDLLYGLRGEPAVQLGLVPALRKGLVKTLEEKTGIQISLSVSRDWPRALAADPALHLYRIIQEALNNVVLHAHANSTRVRLEVQGGDQAVVVISDDGSGFPAQPNLHASRFGIVGMRERATLMGGGLKVESSPRGTTVRLTVPLDSLS